ncbi:MAG: hypothetical protein U0235_13375 [Polyangiaceae bacterium]
MTSTSSSSASSGDFRGYVLDYAKAAIADKRHYTWAVLKAHTQNRAGTVRLVDSNPRRTLEINFHYFDEGYTDACATATRARSNDLEAVCAGVELARSYQRLRGQQAPDRPQGPRGVAGRRRARGRQGILREWVKNEAWGHHGVVHRAHGRGRRSRGRPRLEARRARHLRQRPRRRRLRVPWRSPASSSSPPSTW